MKKEQIKKALIKCKNHIMLHGSNQSIYLCFYLKHNLCSIESVLFITFYKPSLTQFTEIYTHPYFLNEISWWSYYEWIEQNL